VFGSVFTSMAQSKQSEKKPDRRVERSKQALLNAQVSLMIEKGYEATTIADIAERANVGRSTFYAHFADKEDLFRESLEGLRSFLLTAASAATPRDVHPALAFALPMLEHVSDAKDLFNAIVGQRSAAFDMVHALLVDLVLNALANVRLPEGVSKEIAAEHIVGSFVAIARSWMSQVPQLSPVEIDAAFRRLMAGL
jgi:AcrR family transcriptional regulator